MNQKLSGQIMHMLDAC